MAEAGVGKEAVVTAEKGAIEINAEGDRYIVLKNGSRIETENASAATRVVDFQDYGVRLDIRVDDAFRSTRANSQPLSVLLALPTPENQAELLWRFSWPLAALNLVLLAIPLSCTSPRAGRSLNLLMAALIFILYLNGLSVAESWVTRERLSLISALLLLNGSVFLIAVLLFVRRIWMTRWLPRWMSVWYWKQRRSEGGR